VLGPRVLDVMFVVDGVAVVLLSDRLIRFSFILCQSIVSSTIPGWYNGPISFSVSPHPKNSRIYTRAGISLVLWKVT